MSESVNTRVDELPAEELLSQLPSDTIPNRIREIGSAERKLIAKQWKTFQRVAHLSVPENEVLKRHERGEPELAAGTLVHGIRTWSRDMIESIARMGIVSGELVGVHEDNETHFCADFFRVPSDVSIAQYVNWYQTTTRKTPGGLTLKLPESSMLPRDLGKNIKRLAFIVDAKQPDLQPLLTCDAYRDPDARKIARNLLGDTPEEQSRLAAIVCGIPANFLSGILVTPGLEADVEDIAYLRALFGEKMPIFNVRGTLVGI